MGRSAARRFRALLLAIAFVGGSFGLPALDAVLFHGASAPAPRPHYDPAGGCGDHAEGCTLATAFTATQLAPTRPTSSFGSVAPTVQRAVPVPNWPRSAPTARLPFSRAPPLLQPLG